MPKFLVSMNVVEARSAKFIIEAEEEVSLHDGISNIDMDILEKNIKWYTSEYEPPIIDDVKIIPEGSKGYAINKKIQKEFDKAIKQLDEAN